MITEDKITQIFYMADDSCNIWHIYQGKRTESEARHQEAEVSPGAETVGFESDDDHDIVSF